MAVVRRSSLGSCCVGRFCTVFLVVTGRVRGSWTQQLGGKQTVAVPRRLLLQLSEGKEVKFDPLGSAGCMQSGRANVYIDSVFAVLKVTHWAVTLWWKTQYGHAWTLIDCSARKPGVWFWAPGTCSWTKPRRGQEPSAAHAGHVAHSNIIWLGLIDVTRPRQTDGSTQCTVPGLCQPQGANVDTWCILTGWGACRLVGSRHCQATAGVCSLTQQMVAELWHALVVATTVCVAFQERMNGALTFGTLLAWNHASLQPRAAGTKIHVSDWLPGVITVHTLTICPLRHSF